MASSSRDVVRLNRHKLPGYKDIELCEKGSLVFYEVWLCRKKNKKIIKYTQDEAIQALTDARAAYRAAQAAGSLAAVDAGLQHVADKAGLPGQLKRQLQDGSSRRRRHAQSPTRPHSSHRIGVLARHPLAAATVVAAAALAGAATAVFMRRSLQDGVRK